MRSRQRRTQRPASPRRQYRSISALMVRLLSRISGWVWRNATRVATAIKHLVSPAEGQPPRPALFTFETIEPRVLLSGDLSIGAMAYAPTSGTAGSAASATIQLLKQGNDLLGDPVRVKVYASPDTTLDGGDRLLGQFDVPPAQLGADSSVQVQVPLDTGALALPGDYHLIAVADSENHYAETDETNNSAVTSTTLAVTGTLGDTPSGIIPAITLTDDDGTRFTLGISGPGTVIVTGGGAGYALQVNGSDATTRLTLNASGGDSRVLLSGVTVAGALQSFSAANADLAGALSVSGALRTLQLRDATGAQISTGGSGLLDLTGRNFSGVQLQTTQVADVVKLNAWTGDAAAPSSFKAGGLNNLSATQQFSADLVLSGARRRRAGAGHLQGRRQRRQQPVGHWRPRRQHCLRQQRGRLARQHQRAAEPAGRQRQPVRPARGGQPAIVASGGLGQRPHAAGGRRSRQRRRPGRQRRGGRQLRRRHRGPHPRQRQRHRQHLPGGCRSRQRRLRRRRRRAARQHHQPAAGAVYRRHTRRGQPVAGTGLPRQRQRQWRRRRSGHTAAAEHGAARHRAALAQCPLDGRQRRQRQRRHHQQSRHQRQRHRPQGRRRTVRHPRPGGRRRAVRRP